VAFHAASLAGGVVTTINPLYTADELRTQLADSGARFLVTMPACAAKAMEAVRGSNVREMFVFGEAEGAMPFDSLLERRNPPAVSIDPRHDLVALPYSSGTTGLPKGVMLTHYNLVANIVQSARVLGVGESDTLLGVLPFFHIYGMVVVMNLSLHVGATLVIIPRFDLEQCLQALEKHRVTFAAVVPPIVLALAKTPAVAKYDLSGLRALFSGAAPLSAAIAQTAADRMGCDVLQGYGLTEMSPVTHTARAGDPGLNLASVGPPVPNTEARIVDLTTGAELGANETGEICVRGPQMMRGYLNQPEATAAMIAADGWLHTGDVGYSDDHGRLFVVDRVKELIKYKGLQIAPAELENVLYSHPAVADAAVIPIADDEAGQVPKAFVVLKQEADSDSIMKYVAERVAPYKKLRCIEIVEQIPRSPSGKILRRILVQRASEKPTRSAP
jgi:acyl-CoA synthetase (AMP-forming)/AMP-acid ligase II